MKISLTVVRRCLVASIASIIAVVGVVAPASAATNDTYNSQQWGLSSTGAMAVWSTTRGAGVIVAIVDSGTGPHPDLDANIDPGVAISGGVEQTDATDVDNEGHGTHVSGIVAALADNALGVAGVAPAARILPIRVLDANGSGDSRDVARGIRLAADRGARVVNLSLGGATESSAVTQAIDYAISKGALVVAAAGNGGSLSTPKWPASYDATIAVTSVDPDDQSPAFAQRGDYIDIAAPGVRILSTAKGEYNLQSGTSMSAAFEAATDMRKTLRVGATINGQARFSATLGKVIAIWSREAKLTVGAPAKLSTLLGSPSTGARSIRLLSGNCSIRNLTVVAFT
ncbi:MAG: hypothetical protein EBZ00_05400, partial [Actinobacteria bacterium]|nr:hypothetical protein [Actinomycetota bacterium]